MKRLFILIIFSVVLFGQSKIGTSAAHFLGIGLGPKAIGMSGAFTSIADDASTLYWNVGGISRLDQSQAMFSTTDWLVDTNLNLFAIVLKLDQANAIGIYFTQLDYGSEEITDLYNQTGTGLYWTASDIVTGLSYARNLTDRFSIGGTLKYIRQNIYNESASSVALDFGLLYINKNDLFRIGMSISNFGSDMTMDGKDLFRQIDLDPDSQGHNETIVAKLKTDSWPLPLLFRVGVSSNVVQTDVFRATIATDFLMPSDDLETGSVGAEIAFLDRVFLRGGYRSFGNPSSEEGFTLGGGAKAFIGGISITVDYAVQDFGIFGYIPHWGLSVRY
jgi:hypothetical protein